MAQAVSFERYFERPHQPSRPTGTPVRERTWRSWESWLTLSLVILVQLPVVGSLQTSDWVSEMPSLLAPAAAGLTAAWVLGHMRLNGGMAALAGLGVGAVTTVALVLQTMVLADPEATGLGARWSEFRLRLLEWGRALVDSGISTDPLPFVVLLVSSVFLVAFVSTWAVVRWRNPWVALVPGGFVLLTNISYLPGQPAFSFVVFILAAVLLVARLTYLRAVDRWSSEGVKPSDGMSVEVVFAGGVVALVLVAAAWVIPTANNWGPVADTWGRVLAPVNERVDRLGQLFVGVGSKKPIPVHALGASLPLQGEIFLNTEVLFEVVAEDEMNVRGAVYDEYTGRGWRVSSAAPVDLLGTTVEAAELGTPASRAEIREPLRVEVTVVSEHAPGAALLSAGDPVTTDADARLLLDSSGRALALVPSAGAVRPGTSYSTVGTVSVAAIPTLLEAGTDYPQSIRDRYTALPPDLPPEVADLASTVTSGAQTPYEAARLVETYLRQNYQFSLAIEAAPPGSDAVAHFLLESQQGYFDQFSSSMAVMLRSLGIPTRVAVGFALDDADLDAETKAYRVTEERAWAWPEVFFPGLGWVEFNPTPSRGVVGRPESDDAARDARDAVDPAVDDDFNALLDDLLLDLLDEEFRDSAAGGEAITTEDSALRETVGRIIAWTLIASTLAIVLIVIARFWWERAYAGLAPAERRWAKVQRLASWAGFGVLDDRTPAESAEDLAPRIGEPAALRGLARSYTGVRYGGPEAAEETEDQREQADEQYRTVRNVLRRLVVRRVFRLGRVQGGPLARRGPTSAIVR